VSYAGLDGGILVIQHFAKGRELLLLRVGVHELQQLGERQLYGNLGLRRGLGSILFVRDRDDRGAELGPAGCVVGVERVGCKDLIR
jgi:hypothetical protein